MGLTAAQTSKVHQIFGLPEIGTGFVGYQVVTIYGPFGEEYDFTALTTELAARCSALGSEPVTRAGVVIAEWDVIGSTNPLTISKASGGSEGEIVNYPKQRENIRQELAKILGFVVPVGGFLQSPPCSGGRVSR